MLDSSSLNQYSHLHSDIAREDDIRVALALMYLLFGLSPANLNPDVPLIQIVQRDKGLGRFISNYLHRRTMRNVLCVFDNIRDWCDGCSIGDFDTVTLRQLVMVFESFHHAIDDKHKWKDISPELIASSLLSTCTGVKASGQPLRSIGINAQGGVVFGLLAQPANRELLVCRLFVAACREWLSIDEFIALYYPGEDDPAGIVRRVLEEVARMPNSLPTGLLRPQDEFDDSDYFEDVIIDVDCQLIEQTQFSLPPNTNDWPVLSAEDGPLFGYFSVHKCITMFLSGVRMRG